MLKTEVEIRPVSIAKGSNHEVVLSVNDADLTVCAPGQSPLTIPLNQIRLSEFRKVQVFFRRVELKKKLGVGNEIAC